MSLRKSPVMTPALLAANRRNARQSTGPRTAQGKAQTSLNRMQTGSRSALFARVMEASARAPLGAAERTILALLTPEEALQPLFAAALRYAREEDRDVAEMEKYKLSRAGTNAKIHF